MRTPLHSGRSVSMHQLQVFEMVCAKNRAGPRYHKLADRSSAGVEVFKSSNADIIVSVGGGSPVDASKAIIYFLQKDQGGPFKRQIAIPTTLSAAEYTIGAGYKGSHLPPVRPRTYILIQQTSPATRSP